MPPMPDSEEEREQERPRPKVVDKRVSSGGHTPRPAAPPPEATPPAAPTAPAPEAVSEPPPDQPTEQELREAEAMAREISARPSIDWVVNTAVTLANVAATKLQLGAAADARLAIDSLDGILKATTGRLEDAEAPLKQTLAQLQLAYAQAVSAGPTE